MMLDAFRSLGERNFRLYFLGQIISLIGTWVQQVAVSWLTYTVTGSPWLLGLIGFAGQIPLLLLAPLGGSLADRFPRRDILLVTQWVEMGVATVLALIALHGHFTASILVASALVLGIASAIEMPTRQAFLPELLHDRRLMGNAIALNSTVFNAARLVGPALAAGLLALTGDAACFIVNALSFVAAIYTLMQLQLQPHQAPAIQALAGGGALHWLRQSPPARWLLLTAALTSLCLSPFMTLMPVYARDVFHGGPATLGLLMGASGCGALISALMLASRRRPHGLESLLLLALVVIAVIAASFAGNRHLGVAIFLSLLSGASFITVVTSCNILLQSIVPDTLRGRIMALYSMSFLGMMPLGSLLSGSLAHRYGSPVAFFAAAIPALLLALLLLSQGRRLRRQLHQALGHPHG